MTNPEPLPLGALRLDAADYPQPAPAPEVPAPSAASLAAHLGDAWREWLLRARRTNGAHASVYASAWRPCERRMVLECTAPELQPPFEAAVLARFRRGDDRERDLLVDLARIGRDADPPFDVLGQQERFALRDRKGRAAIVGKVDARIKFAGGVSAPLEVKAWHPSLVDRIESFDDLFGSPWTRAGGYQLLSYLYGAEEPFGFLLLDRSGLPLIVPVALDEHLDRMEEFLTRAERVLDHVAAGTLPDFFDDPTECKRCPFFGGGCNPPLTAPNVLQVLNDPVLEADLERWHALKPAGKEWATLDADLKSRLRGVEAGVAGHFSIVGKWGKGSRVEMPPALKAQYTITEERSRFTLEIERL